MAGSMPIIDGTTRIMGVIGDPIKQIKTPQAINPIFAQMGANIVCVPFHIPADGLVAAWAGLKAMKNLVGLGVTLPHKQAVMALCDSVDDAARRVGAVNVVRREADGSLRGYQFDGPGFVRGLLAEGHQIAGRDCLLIGAGGAATAVAFSLLDAGARHLRIANRTQEKAEAMARRINEEIGGNRASAAGPVPKDGDLVVNATSLGMNPDDALPVAIGGINGSMLVADIVASPEITPLLAAAAERGAAIHSGIHMIRNQVGLIARHFTESQG